MHTMRPKSKQGVIENINSKATVKVGTFLREDSVQMAASRFETDITIGIQGAKSHPSIASNGVVHYGTLNFDGAPRDNPSQKGDIGENGSNI